MSCCFSNRFCNSSPCGCRCNSDTTNCMRGPAGPQGPPGVQGPQGIQGEPGPAASIESMLVANAALQTVAAGNNINLGAIVNNTSSASIAYTAPDTITLSSGTYYIVASFLTRNTVADGNVGATLRVNGATVGTASEYFTSESTTPVTVVLQHNLTVVTGATAALTLANASTTSIDYQNLTFSVLKLG